MGGYISDLKLAIAAGMLVCASLTAMHAQEADPCGTVPERQQKEADLRRTVSQILRAISSKDTHSFLKYVDNQGFGVWGGELSVDEVGREFRQRHGLYCLLFSTRCIASAKLPNGAYINTEKWKISYSEWLSKNPSPKVEIELFFGGQDDPCHANVAIRTQQKSRDMEETFELAFGYKAKRSWVLEGTPAWPEGIARRSNINFYEQGMIEAINGD